MSKSLLAKISIHIALIIGLVFAIWGKTLNLGIWGDGFYFFNPIFKDTSAHLNIWTYNSMARLIWNLIIPVFRDNQMLYLLMQLIFFSVMVILVYLIATELTKNSTIGIVTSVIFLSNYGAVYEMLAEGNVNRFLDRVPNLLIVLVSLLFLIRFFNKKTKENLLLSYIIFTVGVFFGHFASFTMPFFVFYSIFSSFKRDYPLRSITKGVLIGGLFVFITLFITGHSDQKSSLPLSYYLNPQSRYIEKTFYILVPLIVPNDLVVRIGNSWPGGAIPRPYLNEVAIITVILIIISIVIGKYFYKKNKEIFKVYLACVLTMITTTALMIYTDPVKYDPFKYFDPGRQLFIQSIFYSLVLSIIVVTFLRKRKKYFLPSLVMFLAIFVIYNTKVSWKNISNNQYTYEGNKKYLSYIRSIYPKFNDDTVVVVGPRLMQMSTFIDEFYSPPTVTFVSAPEDIATILKKNKKNVYVIDVDYNVTSDGYYLPERVKIIDLSPYYQSGKLNLSQWGTEHIKDYESSYNIK